VAVVEVLASFSIYGDETLTAAHVTEVLGFSPSRTHEFGEVRPSRRPKSAVTPYKNSYWSWWEEPTERTDDDPHGMRSLRAITTRFAPLSDELAALRAEGYDMHASILGTSNSEQIGFVIEADIIQGLARMGVSLWDASQYEDD
jgi:hypothetical protein